MITATRSSPDIGEYDPWIDLNDDGQIDLYDAVTLAGATGAFGTPINKTELLLDLQAKVNGLEAKSNETKMVRFYTPNETYANATKWFTAAVFTWIPDNPTNNAIISCTLFFEYKAEVSGAYGSCDVEINGYHWGWNHQWGSNDYQYSVSHSIPLTKFNVNNGWTEGVQPNGPYYNIVFRTYAAWNNNFVKNIHVILTVMDGLPVS
jgi:hypothetical protein